MITEGHRKKLEKLLDETYPQGDILKVYPYIWGPEVTRAVSKVQMKVDELREAIREAEDVLKAEGERKA
jgi:hypothetical protein